MGWLWRLHAGLLEANAEWQLQHRYMQTEVMAELTPPPIDAVPPQTHRGSLTRGYPQLRRKFHHVDGRDCQRTALSLVFIPPRSEGGRQMDFVGRVYMLNDSGNARFRP